jgi:hypothetical protein
MEKKFCQNCFKTKPLSAFALESYKRPSKGYKTRCKECCSEIESRRFYETLLEKFPEKYWECDVCDHIVKVEKKVCTKCKMPRGAVDSTIPRRHYEL